MQIDCGLNSMSVKLIHQIKYCFILHFATTLANISVIYLDFFVMTQRPGVYRQQNQPFMKSDS